MTPHRSKKHPSLTLPCLILFASVHSLFRLFQKWPREKHFIKGVRCPLFFHQTYTHKQACIKPPVVLEDFSRFAAR